MRKTAIIFSVIGVVVLIGAAALLFDFSAQEPMQEPSNNSQDDELIIEDIQEGSGPTARVGDTVAVHYVGTLEDGTQFDNSRERGVAFSFKLGSGSVIAGWDQGLVGMKEGGVRKLVVPPELAYGNQSIGNVIPPNATLTFEVELLSVQ